VKNMTDTNKPTLKVHASEAMANYVGTAQTHIASGVLLVASGVAYMLNVNYFRDATDEQYLPKGRAIEEMKAQIAKHTGQIGTQMLGQYYRNTQAVFDAVTKSPKKYAGMLEDFASKSKPDAAAEVLNKWLVSLGATSHRKLSTMLGYKTGNEKPAQPEGTPGTRLQDTVAKAIQRIENSEDFAEVRQPQHAMAKAIANAVSEVSPIVLAAEAIQRAKSMAQVSDLDTLLDLATTINSLIETLSAQADKPVKAKPVTRKAQARAEAAAN
jgi:hypothetical protein